MTATARFAFAGLLTVSAAFGIDIATGKMLGGSYDPRAFYLRGPSGQWFKTYSGSAYRLDAAGASCGIAGSAGTCTRVTGAPCSAASSSPCS